MKVHSYHITPDVARLALNLAKREGRIAGDVYFDTLKIEASRSKPHGLIIKLAAADKTSSPRKTRYWANTGTRGSVSDRNGEYGHYAATYDEWGWFYAYLYTWDVNAQIVSAVGKFNNVDDFRVKTDFKYIAPDLARFEPIPTNNPWE